MNKINLSAVPVDECKSPKGKFRLFRQDIHAALHRGNGQKSHGMSCPFEVEVVRLPPRGVNWPYHSHSAQWEFYMIVAGRGQARTPAGFVELHEGDCLMHPPGEAHQIINTGAVDLIYYVVADNPVSDTCHFSDSNKWMFSGQTKPVRLQPVGFFEGEE